MTIHEIKRRISNWERRRARASRAITKLNRKLQVKLAQKVQYAISKRS